MIKNPVNQVRLTNVAIVRYRHKGKRYELACYKNKVVDWREGLYPSHREKDLDEVLQTHEVYYNVSKGVVAPHDAMFRAFEETTLDAAIKIVSSIQILEHGDLQVSELERKDQYDVVEKEIAQIINEKCISTSTGKPVPVTVRPMQIILKAMEEMHFSVKPGQSAKKQALHAMKSLHQKLALIRTKMRVRLIYPIEQESGIHPILGEFATEETITEAGRVTLRCLIDPDVFHNVNKFIEKQGLQNLMNIEVIDASVADFPLPTAEEIKEEAARATLVAHAAVPVPKPVTQSRTFGCLTCPGAVYQDLGEQRSHFKTDWHKVNIKRKVAGKDLLVEPEFQMLRPEELNYWLTLKNL